MVTVPPFDRCITLPKVERDHLEFTSLSQSTSSFNLQPLAIRSLSGGVVFVLAGATGFTRFTHLESRLPLTIGTLLCSVRLMDSRPTYSMVW